ncbi:MAG: alkaline phosphatase family protein [Actinomycetota bacterium]|nr:alkaline phosphatase family protein [Actinomycetota bacterium]
MIRTAAGFVAVGALLLGCTSADQRTDPSTSVAPPKPAHVFVIMLENTSYEESFGPDAAMPYLANDLTEQGVLLTQFYGIAHNSLGNYLGQISGQAPNPSTQFGCTTYSEFVSTGTGEYGQVLGDGCVFPSSVLTIGDQLTAAGLTWRAYGQDMAADPDQAASCRHPVVGTADTDQSALPDDGYATRHMPFVYFHSIIDSPDCATNVVDLDEFEADIATLASTPNLSYLVPGLCDDGHDSPCADGSAGGAPRADEWLRTWVPKILVSPAMADGGLLIITFDEAEAGGDLKDAGSCCGDLPSPNLDGPAGVSGPGGGRIGAVLIGAAVAPGSVSDTSYNHYSLLCSLEQLWGLDRLGYAGHPSTPCFGADVYTAAA